MSNNAQHIINTIVAQVQLLLNNHVINSINTGNRTVDNSFTIIVNSLLLLFGTWFYYILFDFTFNLYYFNNKIKKPTDINIESFPFSYYKIEDIEKYKFSINLSSDMGHSIRNNQVFNWINDTFKKHNFDNNSTTIVFVANDGLQFCGGKSSISNYFMPIWQYKLNNKTEFIWICKSKILSNDFEELKKLINEIKKHEDIAINCQSISIYEIMNNATNCISLVNKGLINKKKTFNTIFFDQKKTLIDMLIRFKEEKMYPSGLSLDNKLGILLYGPPGTGKTGCISAIANFLERNILIVDDFSKEEKVFEIINKHKKTHIIVFDEFDYILSLQQQEDKFADKIREIVQNTQNIEERKTLLEQIKKNENKDFFSKFLKFLDGIEDNDGRVIIATTNFPSKINKLFMRPGRFDLKLELSYCSEQMFYDILHCVFPDCNNISGLGEILSKNVSPLVLINSLLRSNTPDEIIPNILHELRGCNAVHFDT